MPKFLEEMNDNGTFPKSNGGTEQMYRGLMKRIGTRFDDIQLYVSRVNMDVYDDTKKFHIVWFHDLPEDPANLWITDENVAKFDAFVFVSEWQLSRYLEVWQCLPDEKCHVIRNAVEPMQAKNKSLAPGETLNLVYHTTPHRGLVWLLKSFEPLRIMCEDEWGLDVKLDVFSSFKVYGWDNKDEQYEQLFKYCKDHPSITYHGYQPNEVVRKHLNETAHIFAYPSIWQETSCIAAMEAVMGNCVVVCSDLGALPELHRDDELSDIFRTFKFSENPDIFLFNFMTEMMGAIGDLVDVPIIEGYGENSEGYISPAFYDFSWDDPMSKWNKLLDNLETTS